MCLDGLREEAMSASWYVLTDSAKPCWAADVCFCFSTASSGAIPQWQHKWLSDSIKIGYPRLLQWPWTYLVKVAFLEKSLVIFLALTISHCAISITDLSSHCKKNSKLSSLWKVTRLKSGCIQKKTRLKSMNIPIFPLWVW